MAQISAIIRGLIDTYGTDYEDLGIYFVKHDAIVPIVYNQELTAYLSAMVLANDNYGGYYKVHTTSDGSFYRLDSINRQWVGYSENFEITVVVGDTTTPTTTITNSICFAKGTILSTDQGNMEIQNIVPGKHTIGEKEICHITKTISPEKKIVCVKKNAFGKNKPNKAITMSGNHCIQCEKGAMVKAKELVANNPKMKFVEYNQEPLYNVLMEDHNVIKVQNLEVETLDPENIVAKIYNSVMDKSTLAKLVKQMNEGIRENNREKYISAEYEIKKRG